VKKDIEEDPLRAGFRQFIDQLRMIAARPRPAPDIAERIIIDLDDDDVAAGFVHVQIVAGGSQKIIRYAPDSEHAEDQPRDCDPQQRMPGFAFSLISMAGLHRAPMRDKG
jgi:hypothetical protein